MPRGRPRKLQAEQAEVAAAIAALDSAREASAKALDEAAEVGSNAFIQTQAKQLLERVEAERAAKATDEPSGVEVGVDYNFIKDDPTAVEPRLARKGIAVRPDHRYHWINRDPRRMERRLNQGWLPVGGGSITNGDSVLASMPETLAQRKDAELAERRRLMQNANSATLEAEGRRNGMEVFTGNKSLRDGLD